MRSRNNTLLLININVKLQPSDNRRTELRAKLYTSAQGNLLPLRLYRRMYPQHLTAEGYPKSKVLEILTTILTAYGSTQHIQHGVCIIPCEFKGKKSTVQFLVTEVEGPAITGPPTSLELHRLVTLNCAVQKSQVSDAKSTVPAAKLRDKIDLTELYPTCFDGIGKFQGRYHITINPSVPPVVHAQRRVSLILRDDIKAELTDMQSRGIITKVNEGEPTAWVYSLVYRRKPNSQLRYA